jgi:hypothetical protein
VEAFVQPLKELPFSRILLTGGDGTLNLAHLCRRHLIADELRFVLREVVKPARTVDELGIRNRIRGAREQIGDTDLIPDVSGHDGQCGVEQAGDALQEIAQQGSV